MFLGHFGAGFSGAAVSRRVSPGTLLMAAQFVDLLWPLLLLFGIERVAVVPGTSAVTPLEFSYYPWSHSGLMVLVWGLLFGGIYYLLRKDLRTSLLLGALVFSHWLLDVLVHVPDLPLFPWDGPHIGLGLWNSWPLTILLELGIFGVGVAIYSRLSTPKSRQGSIALWSLVIFLLIIFAANSLGPPPEDVSAIGFVGLSQWLLVAWGYWIGRTRTLKPRGV
ncbi:hypothetical protein KQI65_07340 [bacterium]|nr:hypothetical protein [bacterium]